MLRLYITRHGETAWNIEKKFQGWLDSPLTKTGIKQAQLLSKRLEHINFNSIYSSPLNRAYETAKILKGTKNIQIIKTPALKEIHLGKWEGMSYNFNHELPHDLYLFWNKPHLYKNSTGETFFQAKKRVLNFLSSITFKSGNILIVTHGVLLKLIMSIYENVPIDKLWETTYTGNTSLTIIEINKNMSKILLAGDSFHLKGEKTYVDKRKGI